MKSLLILIAALLAGCATSPAEVIERGTRFTGNIAGTPLEAARCVARNAEYISGSVLTSVTPIDNGRVELLVRGTGELTTTLSVWRFSAIPEKTAYEVWVNPTLLASPETHIKLMRGPC